MLSSQFPTKIQNWSSSVVDSSWSTWRTRRSRKMRSMRPTDVTSPDSSSSVPHNNSGLLSHTQGVEVGGRSDRHGDPLGGDNKKNYPTNAYYFPQVPDVMRGMKEALKVYGSNRKPDHAGAGGGEAAKA